MSSCRSASARPSSGRGPARSHDARPRRGARARRPAADDGAAVVLIERASGGDGTTPARSRFPGGRAEADDADLVATALREAERGDRAGPGGGRGPRSSGRMESFWIPVSNFSVTPGRRGRPAPARPRRLAGRGRGDRRGAAGGVRAARPDRDRRARRRRVADPIRRVPDRRAPRLGRDGPVPRPAGGVPRLTTDLDSASMDRKARGNHP